LRADPRRSASSRRNRAASAECPRCPGEGWRRGHDRCRLRACLSVEVRSILATLATVAGDILIVGTSGPVRQGSDPSQTLARGALAVTVAFQLARTLRKAPRAVAQELAPAAAQIPGVARAIVAPNGYLNLYLDRTAFLLSRLRREVSAPEPDAGKTIVEHTAI